MIVTRASVAVPKAHELRGPAEWRMAPARRLLEAGSCTNSEAEIAPA